MSFIEQNREALERFAEMSCAAGARVDYVQGGGGNTSVKLAGGLMAIKASGYRLGDIRPDAAYAVLNCDAVRKFYLESDPAELGDVEKAGAEKTKACTLQIEGLPALRPSVEVGFHSLLDTYVIHSHSVYANLASCAVECEAVVREAFRDAEYAVGVVDYTDPGARLTFSIREEMARVRAETGKNPSVIFMKNHGVIATDADAARCTWIHDDCNARVAAYFGIAPDSFPTPCIAGNSEDSPFRSATPYLLDCLAGGKYTADDFAARPLYPDQLVFVGDALCSDPPAVRLENGTAIYALPRAKAQLIEETLCCVTFICEHIAARGLTLSTMGEAAKAFIANWESEKYRRSIAR